MITYQISGRVPSVLKRTVFLKLARACRGVPGLPKRGAWSVGVSFVKPKRILDLNRAYRGKNCPTDVLSFMTDGGRWRKGSRYSAVGSRQSGKELGDIVICPQVAIREAKRRSIDPAEELARLLTHGTLHLAGFDHGTAKEEERMFRLQERVVERVVG